MNNNSALRALAERIIRTEIEKRDPIDSEILSRYVSQSAGVDENGDIVMHDMLGAVVMNGDRPQSLAEHLDDLQKSRPTLFKSNAVSEPVAPTRNPFVKGPQHNLTEQMLLWRSDPEKAEALATEAGLQVR